MEIENKNKTKKRLVSKTISSLSPISPVFPAVKYISVFLCDLRASVVNLLTRAT